MTACWYALHVKPHKERSVYELLKAGEVTVFYPAMKVKPVNPRSRKERPFFPGYLFVRLDLDEEGINALRWTPGAHGLVEYGGNAAIVPEHFVAELQQRLPHFEEGGWPPKAALKPGDRVRIVDGPFAGYEAVFDTHLSGRERVQVLLTFLRDQPKRLQLETSHLEKLRNQS